LAGAFPILIKLSRAALDVGPAFLNRRIISSIVAPVDELHFREYTMFYNWESEIVRAKELAAM